jgi:hypothetical protein
MWNTMQMTRQAYTSFRFWWLFACASPFVLVSCSIDHATGIDAGTWENWGLSDEVVTSVLPTPWGVYAGTSGSGVYRREGDGWTARGLDGAIVTSMLFVPSDGGRLLVSVSAMPLQTGAAAVFATTDSGATWAEWDGGLAAQNGNRAWAFSLAADPEVPDRLFMGGVTEVRRSVDGGRNWELVYGNGGGVGNGVTALAISPQPDGAVWASGLSAIWEGFGVRSDDGGDTWQYFGDGFPGRFLGFSSVLPGRLFAGGAAVYWTDDGGETFVEALAIAAGRVTGLALAGDTIYAAATSLEHPVRRLYRSLDMGNRWSLLGIPPGMSSGVTSMTTDEDGNLLVATGASGVWHLVVQ